MAALAAMVIALTAFGIMKLISEHYIQTQIDTIDHIVSECEQDIFDLQQNERLSEDEQQQLDFLNEYLADLRYLKCCMPIRNKMQKRLQDNAMR